MINPFKKNEEEPAEAVTSSPAGPDAPETKKPVLLTPEQERAASVRELRAAATQGRMQLWQGSVWLWQWHATRLREWCGQGRREDLDGLGAELGVWVRGGVPAVIGYGAWQLVEKQPALLWVVGGVWVVAAFRAEHPEIRAAKRRARAEAKHRGAADAETAVDAELDDGQELDQDAELDNYQGDEEPPVTALVRAEIGMDSGVHLCDLYPAMRESLPGYSQAPDEALRKMLEDHHIPVRRSIRARGVAGRSGVYLSDLPPLPSSEGAPEALSTPLSTREDAGQAGSGERRGEQRRGARRAPEDPGERALQIEQDPHNPVRWHVSHVP